MTWTLTVNRTRWSWGCCGGWCFMVVSVIVCHEPRRARFSRDSVDWVRVVGSVNGFVVVVVVVWGCVVVCWGVLRVI